MKLVNPYINLKLNGILQTENSGVLISKVNIEMKNYVL